MSDIMKEQTGNVIVQPEDYIDKRINLKRFRRWLDGEGNGTSYRIAFEIGLKEGKDKRSLNERTRIVGIVEKLMERVFESEIPIKIICPCGREAHEIEGYGYQCKHGLTQCSGNVNDHEGAIRWFKQEIITAIDPTDDSFDSNPHGAEKEITNVRKDTQSSKDTELTCLKPSKSDGSNLAESPSGVCECPLKFQDGITVCRYCGTTKELKTKDGMYSTMKYSKSKKESGCERHAWNKIQIHKSDCPLSRKEND